MLYKNGTRAAGARFCVLRSEFRMTLSERFDAALSLARRVHRDQYRKGSHVPYIAHVIGVASIVLEYGGTEDEAIAALLHDALEDAPTDLGVAELRRIINEQFGHDVLAIVEHCSDTTEHPKPPWRERKQRYIDAAQHTPRSAMIVSAADKLHNLRALLRDHRRDGDGLWSRFNPEAGRTGTLAYHRALAEIYLKRFPSPLTEDLNRALVELEDWVGERAFWPFWPAASERSESNRR
jgi:(p)ppGpp synthase/HD superfamily hydrolase